MNELVTSDKAKALKADEEIQKAFRSIETRWVELAIMLLNFRKHEFYRPLGYDGFNAWLEARVSESRASCYSKMRIVEDLSRHIPLSTLQTIPFGNCKLLSKVPDSKREGMTDRAKSMSTTDFADVVGRVPGNSLNGEEPLVPMTFMVTPSQKKQVERALAKIMETGEDPPTRRADALEYICVTYLQGE